MIIKYFIDSLKKKKIVVVFYSKFHKKELIAHRWAPNEKRYTQHNTTQDNITQDNINTNTKNNNTNDITHHHKTRRNIKHNIQHTHKKNKNKHSPQSPQVRKSETSDSPAPSFDCGRNRFGQFQCLNIVWG